MVAKILIIANKMTLKLKIVYLFNLLLLNVFCFGQTKSLAEEAITLENFNFNTKIEVLIPEKYRDESDTDYESYRFSSRNGSPNSFTKNTIFIDENNPKKGIIRTEFYQTVSSNRNTAAAFKNQTFNRVSFVLDQNNQIYVVCAVAMIVTEKEQKDLLKQLNDNYGQYKKYKGKSTGNYYVYEWQTKDKIIRYSSVFVDGNDIIEKHLVDEEHPEMVPEKKSRFEGYFYLIKKQKIKDTKNLEMSDFNFIN